jgi:hypothetical protein
MEETEEDKIYLSLFVAFVCASVPADQGQLVYCG